ncbi:SusC/RagA family TonB-linked outer membrane protein [Dysgonomonas sp. 521]|uniref:SusC/RagA family TonB-linked outer membrane protein n=1 Tax=Dysgonomonas sp. 521 TaxID=2302932 RepID=UPI0013D307F1|nr:SusC/RagA family TonB-linked outer membrane protein [Dysgonomonas sp. 521]NDV94222.1 SusC/RagA family TonB-linked outer membrane protein [Dysgonomonas sp. 521]
MKKRVMLILSCLLLSIGFITAQTTRVTGVVVDDIGEPVIGASVVVKGTTVGTITEVDGTFGINVPEGRNTLVFSLVGMQPVEATAAQDMKVVMKNDDTALAEVEIVGAMGINRSPRSVGFAQSVVDPKEAVLKAEPDLFRSLSGKIPGVHIASSSSTPGSATKVQVRGATSFYGSNEPLYVVDGIPYNNPQIETGNRLTTAGAYGTGISTLDPNDIASMDVLKGAAAAALYGSRAANGVVLITTKSGSKRARPSQKKLEVTLASSYSVENIASLPKYQNMYGQGSNFTYSNANGSWGPAFGSLATIPTYPDYLKAYPDMDATMPYQAYPNNVKDLFNTGGIFDNSVNVISYNDKGSFSTTVSYIQQDGIVPHSEFDRTSFSVGGNQKLDNGIVVGGTLAYSKTNQSGPFFGAGNYGGSVSSFARTMLMPRNVDAAGLPYEKLDGSSLMAFSGSSVDNPLWSWKNNKITSEQERITATVNVSYDITKWLSAYYQYGLNHYRMDRKQVINIGSTGPSGFVGQGQITDDNYKSEEFESNFNLTFKHKIIEDLDLRAVFGHNANQRKTVQTQLVGNKMIYKGIYNISNTEEQTADIDNTRNMKRRLWALYTDISLNYKNYAFFNFTLRNDHSSTLPVKNNSYFYPSFSGSFVFSEAFGIEDSALSFGKLRASWGRVGNDASPYAVNGAFGPNGTFGGKPLMYLPTTLYDPELKPEFKTEYEFGTELLFFGGRAGLDFTWYHQTMTDQIASVSLARSTGSSAYYTNFGKMTNKGIEMGLTLVPVELRNSFRWHIYGVFTKNVNKVVELTGGLDQMTISTNSSSEPQILIKPGYSYGYLRGSGIARDEDGTPLINPNTGTYMEASEWIDLGDPYPDSKLTITNTFSYKGFTLSAMFDASFGGKIISGTVSDLLGRGVTRDTENRLGTRVLYGVLADPDTQKPLLDASGNRIMNTVQMSENELWFASSGTNPTFAMNGVHEFQTFDATVFRLNEITLGYDIPAAWLKKTFIGSATVSVIGRNLWYYAPGIPKYTKFDPSSNSFGAGNAQGIERETAPTARRIGFNVKLTF